MVVMNIMTGWGHNSEMFIRMKCVRVCVCVCVCVWGGVLRMRKCVGNMGILSIRRRIWGGGG